MYAIRSYYGTISASDAEEEERIGPGASLAAHEGAWYGGWRQEMLMPCKTVVNDVKSAPAASDRLKVLVDESYNFV